jgi:hypothetical protein
MVYFDRNSPTGHPSPDKWLHLEMHGNLRSDMVHNCPMRHVGGGNGGTLDSTTTQDIIATPELLKTAEGLIELL